MKSKTFAIGILSTTALILLIAQFIPVVPPARAADTIKDRDYSLATAASSQGGDIIYVTDNRTGMMATFSWDGARHSLQVRAVYSLADAFR